ncbi:hypothetical protein A3710_17425 [Stutzerimonas frequens]|uniref:hypothetical protein n=1 Tax=Stutzerimonas frequens TaxID=2968969 RepID=UPI0007BAB3A4|nr:hypothetical protein [Stutzerimonas frequens]KZX63222.1 hypothetical protein A3710_17425 [Stutzerimonas frequens]
MTKHDLKELAAMGAELEAAKAEVERLRGLLTQALEFTEANTCGGPDVAQLIAEMRAAVSQQAEPKCVTCNDAGIVGHSMICPECVDTWQKAEPAPAQDEMPAGGVTIEKDIFGTVHIKMGDFDYIQIQYQYPYTDNASQNVLAKRIAELLTRPAQTEQQSAYVECRECTDCGHVGINDAHPTDATCAMCDWSGPSPVEDQCPDCGKENAMGAACPKCSGRYRILAETHVAAPIAQTTQRGEA